MKRWLPAACVAAMLLALAVSVAAGARQELEHVDYLRFVGDLGAGQVRRVTLDTSPQMRVELKSGASYTTDNPERESFKEELLLEGVRVDRGSDTLPSQWVGMACAGVLGFAVYKHMSKEKGMAVMHASASSDKAPPQTTFADFAGNPEALAGIKTLVDFLRDPERYRKLGVRLPRGVLLYGPPGTGKTLLARALAGEAGVPFLAVSGSDFVQMYVGVGAARVRDLFKKAREQGRCVVFIDEIDALGRRRSGAESGNDERDQTLNALLTEMQGFNQHEGILVVAATNRRDTLDEALLRPGRFDRHIEVGLPDKEARKAILGVCAKNVVLDDSVDIARIAVQTVGFSGAMLESMVNEAGILAASRGANAVEKADVERAYLDTLAGAERENALGEHDRLIVAAHEAGHALASRLFAPEDVVHRVTIIPGTRGTGGYVLRIRPEQMQSLKSLSASVRVALAGRAAEELTFGPELISTGAVSDLSEATRLLYSMAGQMGFLEEAGMLNYELLPAAHEQLVPIMKKRMAALYRETLDALSQNRRALDAIAQALLNQETLDGEELQCVIASSEAAGGRGVNAAMQPVTDIVGASALC